jgi:cell pole-organizing protein PopZ
MEEILASIRRIISEDEPAAEAAPAEAPAPEPMAAEAMPSVEAEEVLELTDPLPEPEPVETHGDLEVHEAEPEPEPVITREPMPMPEPVMAAAAYDDEPLVGDPAADQTASAFGHLARSITMPKGGRTLEDVVSELLRPLLKAWLDENLPTIVQAKVEEEVERIARRRVG